MSDHIVTFAEWESGEVQLTDEVFDPILDPTWGTPIKYRGRDTGTLLGTWFKEVMEPSQGVMR